MKKCPTCDKTFDDNLRFCQTDGTPLVAVEEEAAAPPEDPYKTIVAQQNDLPIPPDDPYKTIVAGMPPVEQSEPPQADKEDVLELKDSPAEEPIDPLKTIVSTDFPVWPEEPEPEAPAADSPPPVEEPPSSGSGDLAATPPDPPKFSEPDLNPPSFGDVSSKTADSPVEPPPAEPSSVELPPVFASDNAPAADDQPSEPLPAAPPSFEAAPDDVPAAEDELAAPEPPPAEPPKEVASEPSVPKDSFGDSPFGKPDNVPIPSPFDDTRASSYQPPSTPMPSYQEPEPTPPSPFDQPEGAGQPLQEVGWNPPPAPDAGWQNQEIGQNTPFQPPSAGMQEPNKTLAFVSLGLGILGVILLIPTLLIVWCGVLPFLLGAGAVITGFLARSRANTQPEQYSGAGLGTGGIILGILSVIGPIAIFILYVVLFAGLNILGNF